MAEPMGIIREEVEVREHSRSPRWRWLAPIAIVVVVGLSIATWLGDRDDDRRQDQTPKPVQAVAVSPNQAVFMVWTEYERWRAEALCAGQATVRIDRAFRSTARYVSLSADALGVAPVAPDVASLTPLYTAPTVEPLPQREPIDPTCLPPEKLVDITDSEAVQAAVIDASKDQAFLAAIANLVWENESPDAYAALRLQAAADPNWPPFHDPVDAAALLAVLVADVEGESTWHAVGTVAAESILIAYGQDSDGSVLAIQVAEPASAVEGEGGNGFSWLLGCGRYEVTLDSGLHRTPSDAKAVRESLAALCDGVT